jgi:hypothetical protein
MGTSNPVGPAPMGSTRWRDAQVHHHGRPGQRQGTQAKLLADALDLEQLAKAGFIAAQETSRTRQRPNGPCTPSPTPATANCCAGDLVAWPPSAASSAT